MKNYRYEIHLRDLDDPATLALEFRISSHDNIIAIAERLKSLTGLDADDAIALGVGLKLFSGITLKHRKEAPFDALQPAMRAFIQSLKDLTIDANTAREI